MGGITGMHLSSAVSAWVVNSVGSVKNIVMMISFNIWFPHQIYLGLKSLSFFFL